MELAIIEHRYDREDHLREPGHADHGGGPDVGCVAAGQLIQLARRFGVEGGCHRRWSRSAAIFGIVVGPPGRIHRSAHGLPRADAAAIEDIDRFASGGDEVDSFFDGPSIS